MDLTIAKQDINELLKKLYNDTKDEFCWISFNDNSLNCTKCLFSIDILSNNKELIMQNILNHDNIHKGSAKNNEDGTKNENVNSMENIEKSMENGDENSENLEVECIKNSEVKFIENGDENRTRNNEIQIPKHSAIENSENDELQATKQNEDDNPENNEVEITKQNENENSENDALEVTKHLEDENSENVEVEVTKHNGDENSENVEVEVTKHNEDEDSENVEIGVMKYNEDEDSENNEESMENNEEEFDFEPFSLTSYWQSAQKEFTWLFYGDSRFRCRICEEGYSKSRLVQATTWSCPDKMPKVVKSNAIMYSRWYRFDQHQETSNHEKAAYVIKNSEELENTEAGPDSLTPNVRTRKSTSNISSPLIQTPDKSDILKKTKPVVVSQTKKPIMNKSQKVDRKVKDKSKDAASKKETIKPVSKDVKTSKLIDKSNSVNKLRKSSRITETSNDLSKDSKYLPIKPRDISKTPEKSNDLTKKTNNSENKEMYSKLKEALNDLSKNTNNLVNKERKSSRISETLNNLSSITKYSKIKPRENSEVSKTMDDLPKETYSVKKLRKSSRLSKSLNDVSKETKKPVKILPKNTGNNSVRKETKKSSDTLPKSIEANKSVRNETKKSVNTLPQSTEANNTVRKLRKSSEIVEKVINSKFRPIKPCINDKSVTKINKEKDVNKSNKEEINVKRTKKKSLSKQKDSEDKIDTNEVEKDKEIEESIQEVNKSNKEEIKVKRTKKKSLSKQKDSEENDTNEVEKDKEIEESIQGVNNNEVNKSNEEEINVKRTKNKSLSKQKDSEDKNEVEKDKKTVESIQEVNDKPIEDSVIITKRKLQLADELFPPKKSNKPPPEKQRKIDDKSQKSRLNYFLNNKYEDDEKLSLSEPRINLEKMDIKTLNNNNNNHNNNNNNNNNNKNKRKIKSTDNNVQIKKSKLKSPRKSTELMTTNDRNKIINDKIEIYEKLNLTGVSKRKSSTRKRLISIDRTIKPNYIDKNQWIELINDFFWLYSSNNYINCFICEEAYKKFPVQLKKTQYTSPNDFKQTEGEHLFKYNRLLNHHNSPNHQAAYELMNNIASSTKEASKNSITLTQPIEMPMDIPDFLIKYDIINLKSRYLWLLINKTSYGCQVCIDCYKKEPNDMIKSRYCDGLIEFDENENNNSFRTRVLKHADNYRHVTALNLLNSLAIMDSDEKHTRLRDGTARKIDYRKLSLDGKELTPKKQQGLRKILSPKKVVTSPKKVVTSPKKTVHKSNDITCPQCKSIFDNLIDLSYHIELCDEQVSNEIIACPCNPSQYQFKLITKLDLHVSQNHLNKSLFSCYICSESFNLVTKLFYHFLDIHLIVWNPYYTYSPANLIKTYNCLFCSNTFNSKIDLTQHYINSPCFNNLNCFVLLNNCCNLIKETTPEKSIELKSEQGDAESVQLELIDDTETIIKQPKTKRNIKSTRKRGENKRQTTTITKTTVKQKQMPILNKLMTKRGRPKIGMTKKFKAGGGEIKLKNENPSSDKPAQSILTRKRNVMLRKKLQLKKMDIYPKKSLIKDKNLPTTQKIDIKPPQAPKPVEEIKIITTTQENNDTPLKRAKKFAIIFHSNGSPKKSTNITISPPNSKVTIKTSNNNNDNNHQEKELNKAIINPTTSVINTLMNSMEKKPDNLNITTISELKQVSPNQSLSFMDRMKQIRQLKKLRAEKIRAEETLTKESPIKQPQQQPIIIGESKTKDGGCVCIVCNETFRSFTSRDQHIKLCHKEYKLFNCHSCTMHFRTHLSLRKHAQRYHADQIAYAVFGKNSQELSPLNDNKDEIIKTADKKETKVALNNMVKCDICNMVFMNKAGYNLHYTAQHRKPSENGNSEDNVSYGINVGGNNVNTQRLLNTVNENCIKNPITSGTSIGVSGSNCMSTATGKLRKGPEDLVKRLALCNWETDLQSCLVCQETLDNDLEFLIHTLDHEKEVGKASDAVNGQYACPSCCRLFFGKDGKLYLKDHYNMIHLKRTKPTCETCKTQFDSTYCFQQHLRLLKGNCTSDTGNTISDPYSVLHAIERHAYVCNRCQALYAGQEAKERFDKHLEICNSNIDDELNDNDDKDVVEKDSKSSDDNRELNV